jgi:hypothetical protein
VAHEALVRNWPRLVGWLDEEREALRQRFRLREAATAWQQQTRNPDLLWRGAQLVAAVGYRDLNETEQAFVQAGHEAEAAVARAEQAAALRTRDLLHAQQMAAAERQNSRRLGGLLALSGVLLVGAVALAIIAFFQAQAAATAKATADASAVEAQRQASAAATAQVAAQLSAAEAGRQKGEAQRQASAAVTAQAAAESNAVEAKKQAEQAEREKTNAQLQSQRARAQVLIAQDNHAGDLVLILAREAIQTTLAISVTVPPLIDGALRTAVDNATWRMTLPAAQMRHQGAVTSVHFSPDGKRIVSSGADGTLRVWRAADLKPLNTLSGHTARVLSAAYSPDGQRIVSASADQTVRIWDAQSGAPVRTLEGHTDWVWSAAYSPDGQRIVSASADQTVRIWVSTIEELLAQAEARIQRPAHLLMDDERRQLGLAP